MSHKEIKTRFTRLFGLFVWETFVCLTKPERHNKTKHNFALFFQFLVLRYLFLKMVIKRYIYNNICTWYSIIYNINHTSVFKNNQNLWKHVKTKELYLHYTISFLFKQVAFQSYSKSFKCYHAFCKPKSTWELQSSHVIQ